MIFSYDQPPQSREEFEEAISEAWGQAESLEIKAESLQQEADRWYDRAATLEMDYDYWLKENGLKRHSVSEDQIELDPDFFKAVD